MADDLSSAVLSMRIVCESIKEAADALARKDAEIASLREIIQRDSAELRAGCEARDQWRQRAERAEARVREAPVCRVVTASCTDENREPVHQIIKSGQRVALLLLDTEEAK